MEYIRRELERKFLKMNKVFPIDEKNIMIPAGIL